MILDEKTVGILAREYGGLELTHVDDDNAFTVTVGDLCATIVNLRRRLADHEVPPHDGSYQDKWLMLGFRVEWSERQPRAYEIRRVGCCLGDNDCLARLPTVQEVDAWIAEHTNPGEFV